MKTILISTSSFAAFDSTQIDHLRSMGYHAVLNPYKRKLSEDEITNLLHEHKPEGLLAGTEPITRNVLENSRSYLKVISRVGVGWDNVDRDVAAEMGILVYRTPDAVTQAVVELTVGLFFDLARKITAQDRQLRRGNWAKKMGTLVSGKTLGVIGCGRIGKGVCLAMRSLGCNSLAFDPFADHAWHKTNNVPLLSSMDEIFKSSDLISIHASIKKDDTYLVDRRSFSMTKSNLLFVNTARGGLVDEDALFDALKEKRIAGAALDVYSQEPYSGPLTQLDNVVLTPHIGSYAIESRRQMEYEALKNLLEGLSKHK